MHSITPYIVEDTGAGPHGKRTRVKATIELDIKGQPVELAELPRLIGWSLYGLDVVVDGDLPYSDIEVENGEAIFNVRHVEVESVSQCFVSGSGVRSL